MVSETLVTTEKLPCWINGSVGPLPSDMIVFANGILGVEAYLTGCKAALMDPTPDLFTTAALPFDFDPTAQCPNWMQFLRTSLGDDPNKIKLLQEWIGYCMTPDTTFQKMLFMRGPTCSGKGTILNTLTWLVGEKHTAATNFSDLSGPFGLQPLVGKMLCTIGDARTPRHGDVMRGLELLLNIVGNDNVSVNRKNRDQLDLARLSCRIAIGSNEFLDLPDHANALLRRLLLLEFKHSFVGREDYGLEAKLQAEVPGIAVWALEGLKRLRWNKAFTLPESSKEAALEWRLATNPLAAFIEECCELDEGEVQKTELFDAWTAWSTERRIRPVTKSRFFERMRFAAPTILSDTYEKGPHKISVYRGIRLKLWAIQKLLGKPR
jgi:putative DNA primase/helicase